MDDINKFLISAEHRQLLFDNGIAEAKIFIEKHRSSDKTDKTEKKDEKEDNNDEKNEKEENNETYKHDKNTDAEKDT